MRSKPRLLDLFAGGGAAGWGYHLAGFDVTSVDLYRKPLRHNPFPSVQADAIAVLRGEVLDLTSFDAIHASPVCHDWSPLASVTGKNGTGELLHQTLDLLRDQRLPWIVENVSGAPLANSATLDGAYGVELCGTMFGLRVLRHRLFESNVPITAPRHPPHDGGFYYAIAGHGDPNWRHRDKYPEMRGEGYSDRCRAAMGVDWLPRDVLAQAIPPRYTEHLGLQLLNALEMAA